MAGHSPLGMSQAERYFECSASVNLIKTMGGAGELPHEDPDYRKDGTQAHAVLAQCLTSGEDAWQVDPVVCPDVTADMMLAVQQAIDYVRSRVGKAGMLVEVPISHPEFHDGAYGQADVLLFYPEPSIALESGDYKHGQGVIVEVKGNRQTRGYAFMAIDGPSWPENRPRLKDGDLIKLTIMQPRAEHPDGPIRSEVITVGELRRWAEEELRPAMLATVGGIFKMGEWCRFCPVKKFCAPMLSTGTSIAELGAEGIKKLTTPALFELMKVGPKVLRMLATMIEGEAYDRIAVRREEAPGWKIVVRKADRVWRPGAEADILSTAGTDHGYSKDQLYTEPKFLSPARFEALGPRAKELVAEYAFKPDVGYNVVHESDTRKAVTVETAVEAFSRTPVDTAE